MVEGGAGACCRLRAALGGEGVVVVVWFLRRKELRGSEGIARVKANKVSVRTLDR